jgi:uncharacterized membrane protein
VDAASQYALAYALTTTAGLRGFLTLLAASIAIHLGWIHPSATFAWLGADEASVVLAVFAVLELLADKVPVVDHALHATYFVVRPLAAAILVGATVHSESQAAVYAMMSAGALNALVVHGSAATARAASSATTLGFGNVVLSVAEDLIAAGGIAVAFGKPLLAAVLCMAFVIGLLLAARAVIGKLRDAAPRRER